MKSVNHPKVVVITGASAGLGRATARAFGKQGASIGLLSRDRARLEDTKKEIEALGGKALVIPTDVSDPNQIEQAAHQVIQELGPIDIWVNNAMVSVFSPVKEMTPDDYKRVTEVTYLGFVNGTLTALKHMLPKNSGIIVQVGSALAYRGIPLQSAYCGAKHAIKGFTESLRTELLHEKSGVTITMVHMPAMNTPQFNWIKSRLPRKAQPVPPIFQPEIAAKAIVFATQHYRREWYVGFITTLSIVGNKIAPGFVDKYLAKKGYASQQYDGADDPNRPHNLYSPVSGNFKAHGDFDQRAISFSLNLFLNQHRRGILLCLFFLVLVIWAFFIKGAT